jgi:hypothetical protein
MQNLWALLQSVDLKVFKELRSQNLNPVVEFWHDGTGMKSSYKIYATWN